MDDIQAGDQIFIYVMMYGLFALLVKYYLIWSVYSIGILVLDKATCLKISNRKL